MPAASAAGGLLGHPLITFKDFSFTYRSQSEPTLKDLNFTIEQGEKVLIVGPSGSGKSTLDYCINALIPNAFEGTIEGRGGLRLRSASSIYGSTRRWGR